MSSEQLMNDMIKKIIAQIAIECQVKENQVSQAVALLNQGDTVPFIARYRKEKTQGLDDIQLRTIENRLQVLTALAQRKQAIINALTTQAQLTEALRVQIEQCDNKARLEEIYLPFKSKRITKAMQAIDAGLKPLADQLWLGQQATPKLLTSYIKNEFNNVALVCDGAEAIILERHSQNLALLDWLQQRLLNQTWLCSSVQTGKEDEGIKFKDYFDYKEQLKKIPSHRLLAVFRGKDQGMLQIQLDPFVDLNRTQKQQAILELFCRFFKMSTYHLTQWQQDLLQHLWSKKLKAKLENSWFSYYQQQAEKEAIQVFSNNLTSLLLSAPAGNKITIGLDPGLRTGVKVALVDGTGQVLATDTIYPTPPHNKQEQAGQSLLKYIKKYQVTLIAIGNGTGSKETDLFVSELLKNNKNDLPELIQKVIVSEAGASVYSASELASQELSDLDVSLRGAVSIARRLQDPLAELIKIDPKAIGVGQYQHDVDQGALSQSLQYVVEDAVHLVGVDLNQASPSLLSYVSGLNPTIAKNIVDYRNINGPFSDRNQLKKVPRLGDKAFEQSAGFLRIKEGTEPLDQSAVHPEAYSLVRRIAKENKKDITEIIGHSEFLNELKKQQKLEQYVDDQFGLFTINDIVNELQKPGRDPRPDFKTACFDQQINELSDLEINMILEGTVTNVTNFGAFVDIGVHQDGLVHISQLADRYVANPHDVVQTGLLVKVKVIEIDEPRKRIALSMKGV